MRSVSYRQYPPEIKNEIARTGNIYLFPNLRIPRTTAQYWARTRVGQDVLDTEGITNVYAKRAEYLELELQKERALRRLIEFVRRVFPFDFSDRNVKKKSARKQIVEAIKECGKFHPTAVCLNAIGLSKSRYQRWSSEFAFCNRTGLACRRRSAAELTSTEIRLMKNFVTSRKFAHMSIASLHFLAQRSAILFCSIHTWYKYVRYFTWQRPWRSERRKVRRTGIRAAVPNQLWHIDVTVMKIRPGLKLYIQAVIDNFSRFVLAWRVTDSISAASTVETIRIARENAAKMTSIDNSTQIMMDPGSENNNEAVAHFIASKNMLRILARVEVHYSNSMIESLFRGLKNNYLYHQGIRTIEDLARKAAYYFSQHNNIIPQASLQGGIPMEVYRGAWNDLAKRALEEARGDARQRRRAENMVTACQPCPQRDLHSWLI